MGIEDGISRTAGGEAQSPIIHARRCGIEEPRRSPSPVGSQGAAPVEKMEGRIAGEGPR
jgi:hypothetical protein